jgi:hypothetical protein
MKDGLRFRPKSICCETPVRGWRYVNKITVGSTGCKFGTIGHIKNPTEERDGSRGCPSAWAQALHDPPWQRRDSVMCKLFPWVGR